MALSSICSLKDQSPEVIQRNDSDGKFYIDTAKNVTNITGNDMPQLGWYDDGYRGSALLVRRCPCNINPSTPFFCQMEKDTCEVTRSGQMLCWQSSVKIFIGNLFPFLLFWLLVVLFMVVFTQRGRFATSYVLRLLCRTSLGRDLNHLQRRHPDRVFFILRDYHMRTIQSGGNWNSEDTNVVSSDISLVEGVIPNHRNFLALRTKAYDSLSDDEEHVCTICLGSFQKGMRVGSLSCDHKFHVECLKDWLIRRNNCPLCNVQAAEPRSTIQDEYQDLLRRNEP
jgi:Ring finger domain